MHTNTTEAMTLEDSCALYVAEETGHPQITDSEAVALYLNSRPAMGKCKVSIDERRVDVYEDGAIKVETASVFVNHTPDQVLRDHGLVGRKRGSRDPFFSGGRGRNISIASL